MIADDNYSSIEDRYFNRSFPEAEEAKTLVGKLLEYFDPLEEDVKEEFLANFQICAWVLERLTLCSVSHEEIIPQTKTLLKSLQFFVEQVEDWETHGSKLCFIMLSPRTRHALEKLNAGVAQTILQLDSLAPPHPDTCPFFASVLIEEAGLNEGATFWSDNFGSQAHVVPWPLLSRALSLCLLESPSATAKADPSTIVESTKAIVDSAETGFVSVFRFIRFLSIFGPTIRSSLLSVHELCAQAWFHGFMSFEESERLLRGAPIGEFLIRFSNSSGKKLAVAYVTKAGTVNQVKIKRTPEGFQLGSRVFPSVLDMVRENSAVLRVPSSNKFTRCRCFHGYLSFPETDALLRGKPSGSFLFRFSRSEPGAVVLAYVDDHGEPKQCIAKAVSGGGWVLGDLMFTTFEELMRAKRMLLWHPIDVLNAKPAGPQRQSRRRHSIGPAVTSSPRASVPLEDLTASPVGSVSRPVPLSRLPGSFGKSSSDLAPQTVDQTVLRQRNWTTARQKSFSVRTAPPRSPPGMPRTTMLRSTSEDPDSDSSGGEAPPTAPPISPLPLPAHPSDVPIPAVPPDDIIQQMAMQLHEQQSHIQSLEQSLSSSPRSNETLPRFHSSESSVTDTTGVYSEMSPDAGNAFACPVSVCAGAAVTFLQICMTRKFDTVADCGHVLCSVCAQTIINKLDKLCPMCRKKLTGLRRLYIS